MIEILKFLLPVVARFIPDPVQQAQAQAEMTKALLENEQALMQGMAQVMQADAASESWLTRNARPLVVVWGLVMLTFVVILAPALGIQAEVVAGLTGIPSELWTIVTVGTGMWIGGRTIEKAAANLKGK